MALAVDASSPARATNVGAGQATTVSFTAPAGALLVACIEHDTPSNPAALTFTVTDTGGLTWTPQVVIGNSGGNGGATGISTAVCGSSVARTVSVTCSDGLTGSRIDLKVYVVTGQHAVPVGAKNTGLDNATTNFTAPVFTSTLTNSMVFAATSDWNGNGAETSSDLTIDSTTYSFMSPGDGYKALPTIQAQTVNFVYAGVPAATWSAIEVKDANGTVPSSAPMMGQAMM
jgi:hypothetical protein